MSAISERIKRILSWHISSRILFLLEDFVPGGSEEDGEQIQTYFRKQGDFTDHQTEIPRYCIFHGPVQKSYPA